MLNALTVDVEDYFHVEAFASAVSREEWATYPPRVERNVERILGLFGRHEVKATFFVLGWVAERYPRLIRQIAAEGHEIGCHGYGHRRLDEQTPEEFRADLRRVRSVLADQAAHPIVSYRAPSFSIHEETLWAFDLLLEEGFLIDSSLFPVRHDLYGMPSAPRFPHWRELSNGCAIFEFPPSTIRRWGNNWGVGGGGYLRFAPFRLTRWAMRNINEKERQPVMLYFHPWEIDPDQPRIRARWRSRLRHYTNLATTAQKIERLLQDLRFAPIHETCLQLEAYRQQRPPGPLESC